MTLWTMWIRENQKTWYYSRDTYGNIFANLKKIKRQFLLLIHEVTARGQIISPTKWKGTPRPMQIAQESAPLIKRISRGISRAREIQNGRNVDSFRVTVVGRTNRQILISLVRIIPADAIKTLASDPGGFFIIRGHWSQTSVPLRSYRRCLRNNHANRIILITSDTRSNTGRPLSPFPPRVLPADL